MRDRSSSRSIRSSSPERFEGWRACDETPWLAGLAARGQEPSTFDTPGAAARAVRRLLRRRAPRRVARAILARKVCACGTCELCDWIAVSQALGMAQTLK